MSYILIQEDPDILSQIDPKKNIIICEQTDKNIIHYENKIIYIRNHLPIEFFSHKIISQSLVYNLTLYVKFSLPIGITLNFREAEKKKPFINKIYDNYNEIKKYETHNIIDNMDFTLYLDKDRLKGITKLPGNQNLMSIDFIYPVLNDDDLYIENIYHIKNNFVFQKFVDHFILQ